MLEVSELNKLHAGKRWRLFFSYKDDDDDYKDDHDNDDHKINHDNDDHKDNHTNNDDYKDDHDNDDYYDNCKEKSPV